MSISQSSQPQLSQNPTTIFAEVADPQTILFPRDCAKELAPFQHPYLSVEAAIPGQPNLHRYQISPDILDAQGQIAAKSWLSIFIAYCARLSPESEFDLGLKIESQDPNAATAQIPLRIQVQSDDSFSQFRARLEASLDLAARLDLVRDTLLPPDVTPAVDILPVVMAIARSPDRVDSLQLNAPMTFVVYEDGSLPELIHPGALTEIDSEAIVRQLQSFIPACLERPEQPLAQLPLLATAERQQLLVEWNQTETPVPADLCIHQLFEQQVLRTPAAIAVICDLAQLTYQELNARANQLAHYLILHGVEPDTLIGLYMERSIDMVVGLLAIHKAGGAYLPLDPDFPADRLALMLADSQAPIILTQQRLITDLAIGQHVQAIAIDTSWGEIALEPATNPQSKVTPANLAYIIYTSGSTGKPKGVMVEHRNAVNFFTGMDPRIGCQPGVWLAVTSLSFDISVLELCWTLTRGFKVVIYNAKTERTNLGQDRSIAGQIDRHQVTHLQCTPSMAGLLVADPTTRQALSRIQTMMVGGEALTEALALQLQQVVSGQVHNMYGPTETTIWSTTYPLTEVEGIVPLGRPIANTELYILDKYQQPLPIGMSGELLIGGKGVTRGYLHRADLTQERFIPNPFSLDPTARLYRTGDLARYQPDGNLEFLGRIDFQVKIRGYRIELGEIETVLGRHATIQDVAIIVREDVPGDERLVAYFVAQPGQQPTPSELRAYLRSQLPEYMVPTNFIPLQAFPLTPNHKVDRQAFPAPLLAQQPPATDRIDNSAQTIEQSLIEIWQRILQIPAVSITDNFFDLGGHSLIALELFAEIEQIWHQRLLLSILFQSPTIAELAHVIRQQEQHADDWSPLVLIRSGGDRPPLFCIHPIGGTVFGYYNLSKIVDPDRPIYGLQARGIDGKQPPFDRIEDMASYFITAIQTIQPDGDYHLLGYSLGGIIAFEIARQLADRDRQVAFLGLLDIRNPVIKQINISLAKSLIIQADIIKKLTFKQQLAYILDKLFNRNKTVDHRYRYRDEVVIALSDLQTFTPELLNVLDCNLLAMDNYQARVYSGAAHLFWSNYQDLYIDRYPDLGWGDLVAGGLEIQYIPGDHTTLMQEPNVQILAQKINVAISESNG